MNHVLQSSAPHSPLYATAPGAFATAVGAPSRGRGFFTELAVKQGVDPVASAKAGRGSDPNLPMRIYAHVKTDGADVGRGFVQSMYKRRPPKKPSIRKQRKIRKMNAPQ